MTKNVDNILTKLISNSLVDNKAWDLSSFYKYCSSNGYKKSKRTFDREIAELGFYPKVLFDRDSPLLKEIIYRTWEEICISKRLLSLKSSISIFNDNYFIFYEDSRGKKYWHRTSGISKDILVNSFNTLSKEVGKNFLVWPSSELIDFFNIIVDDVGSQVINLSANTKVTLPMSSYKKVLSKENLNQINDYQPSSIEIKSDNLTHLEKIEAEAIHIIRETSAEAENPVMLYSVGKDSAVMLHLAKKAFYPAPPPFPLLHVDTGWKFDEMYQFRNIMAKDAGMELIVHKNQDGVSQNINPFDHGSEIHTDIMKTQALKQALDIHKFDFAFGGARRDEEKSRAKERVLSFRSESHAWDPKNQRPELWDLYNFNKKKSESARVFPISNWTELDIWQYIYK
jgi:sulfate adenylyltransferase subunit 2